MDGGLNLQKAVSEPDSLSIASLIKSNKPCSSASSAASLIHIVPRSIFSNDHSLQRSQSVDQLVTKARALNLDAMFWHSPHSVDAFSSSSSFSPSLSPSSSSNKDIDSHNGSDSLQYARFEESPPWTASLPNHAYIERIMLTSIPRRKEFSEQFQDLAQLHENSDVPLAKWDDASRLFPKQFGVPPLVAISIWKQVDSDADMMLTEAEYCLAAHLATKYSTTGFSLLASPSHLPVTSRHDGGVGAVSSSHSSSPSPRHHQHLQRRGRRRGRRLQRNGLNASYLENEEDDSHDLLLSPDSRLLADSKHSPWSSSSSNHSLSRTFKENTNPIDTGDEEEEYEDEDDHKGVSDDEIGVQALLPSSASIHRRHPHVAVDVEAKRMKERGGRRGKRVGGKRIDNDSSSSSGSSSTPSSSQESSSSSDEEESSSSGKGDVGDEDGSTTNSGYSSVSLTTSPSSSPAPTAAATRVESVCSVSPSAKFVDPVEALCKFTHRSKDDIASFSARRRRRLLVSFVRVAKLTNYTLLRLNNELVGELQELCDQHTNLNAQVRHLSEMGP